MTAPLVFVLSGPNLDRLGTREPEVYGSDTLDDVHSAVSREAGALGLLADCRQTNHEGEMIDWLHEAVDAGRRRRHQPRCVDALLVCRPRRLRHRHDERAQPRRGAPDQPGGARGLPADLGRGAGRDGHRRRLRAAVLPARAARPRLTPPLGRGMPSRWAARSYLDRTPEARCKLPTRLVGAANGRWKVPTRRLGGSAHSMVEWALSTGSDADRQGGRVARGGAS